VEFVEPEDQQQSPDEFILDLRQFLDTIPGSEFEVVRSENGPPTGPPINLEIVGENYEALQEVAANAEEILSEVEGVVDLKSDFQAGRQEIAIRIDRKEAGKLGLSTAMIADTVRAAINGIEASKFRENDEEYDIVVQFAEIDRSELDDVRSLWVKTPDGDRVQLEEIASVEVQKGWGSISHLDSDRVITVSAEAKEGFNANNVLAKAEEAIATGLEMPAGYDYQFTGQNEEQAKAQAFLSKAMLAAVFIIALVLITQFNSLIQPAIILFSVVLSLIGVLLMLLLRGMPFGIIMTGIGVISLAGVVVNNAIVMVDYINQLRDRGKGLHEAVITAGLVRFRPVLLTAITTVLSLLPTVLGVSLDAKEFQIVSGGTSVEMWGPMANAVVGGLVVATILTLVVVPALYVALEWMRNKIVGLFASDEQRVAAPGSSKSGERRNTSPGLSPVHPREEDGDTLPNRPIPDTGGSHA
jgi:multidrug efflux pump subunit AcrB